LLREPIQVGRVDHAVTVRAEIVPAEVVHQYEQYIPARRSGGSITGRKGSNADRLEKSSSVHQMPNVTLGKSSATSCRDSNPPKCNAGATGGGGKRTV